MTLRKRQRMFAYVMNYPRSIQQGDLRHYLHIKQTGGKYNPKPGATFTTRVSAEVAVGSER